MERKKVIEIINEIIKSSNINADNYIPLLSEFLEKKHSDKVDKIIKLILSNPMLLGHTISKVIDYSVREYDLFVLNTNVNGQLKPILYYYEV